MNGGLVLIKQTLALLVFLYQLVLALPEDSHGLRSAIGIVVALVFTIGEAGAVLGLVAVNLFLYFLELLALRE